MRAHLWRSCWKAEDPASGSVVAERWALQQSQLVHGGRCERDLHGAHWLTQLLQVQHLMSRHAARHGTSAAAGILCDTVLMCRGLWNLPCERELCPCQPVGTHATSPPVAYMSSATKFICVFYTGQQGNCGPSDLATVLAVHDLHGVLPSFSGLSGTPFLSKCCAMLQTCETSWFSVAGYVVLRLVSLGIAGDDLPWPVCRMRSSIIA